MKLDSAITKVLSVSDPETALEKLKAELERRTKYLWTTKSGKKVHLNDMSQEHLENTIRMLERIVDDRDMAGEAMAGFDDDLGCHDDTD